MKRLQPLLALLFLVASSAVAGFVIITLLRLCWRVWSITP